MKKIFYTLILLPMLVVAQNQNYIKTTIYKGPGSTLPMVEITYVDGLGRPIQKVAQGQSNTGKDIVNHIEYDGFGRMSKEFLPYVTTSTLVDYRSAAASEQLSYYSSPIPAITGNPSFEATNYPFSQKDYEASPFSRVMKQAAPGETWKLGSGHEIKRDYQANTVADEVKNFTVKAIFNAATGLFDYTITDNGFYQESQLYKTISKDENWTTGNNNTTQEFKNKEGQVLLKRTFGSSMVNNVLTNTKHDIYYLYDQYSNLTFVLPPLAEASVQQVVLDDICYQYKYDLRDRLVEKKLPGKQWEFIVYDKLDRPVASGPIFSPFSDITGTGWMVTKYDAFNRPILSSWTAATITSTVRKTLQDNLNNATIVSEIKMASTDTTINGVAFRYSNTVWPTSGYHVLTVNYYDDYNFPNAQTIPTTVEGQNVFYNTTVKPTGLATGSWVRALETSTLYKRELSYILYDYKARPIRNYTTNHLGGSTIVDSKLDFIGKVEYTITNHRRSSGKVGSVYIKDTYEYSAQDRLLLHKQQIDGGEEQLITSNTYDELGQLVSKNVGGTDATGALGLQKVDYSYNIRGWLKGINDINNLAQGTNPTDLFSFKLSYDTPVTATPLFNGNISETFWKTTGGNVLRKYNYTYDEFNRLTNAVYQKGGIPSPNSFGEAISYDKNGNISKLARTGVIEDDNYALPIDNLEYSYHPTIKNQLMKVFDTTNSASGFKDDTTGLSDPTDDYTYDANGNLIADTNKGIVTAAGAGQAIFYNHLNLPTKIIFGTTGNIEYIYNAIGQKLQKKVTEGSIMTTTLYLGGFQYKNNLLQFFPHTEGYVNNTVDLNGANNYSYVFNYTDHLGNVRLSYTKNATTNVLVILEESHYYPFGLKHSGYNNTILSTNPGQKYKYNGKELQDELGLNFYDYGARNYDAAIGRWMNIDPLAENSKRWTPYNYGYNNPMYFIDPDGMQSRGARKSIIARGSADLQSSAEGMGAESSEAPGKNGVRIVLDLGGHGAITASAETHLKNLRNLFKDDKIIYINDDNLGNLKSNVANALAQAKEEGYGQTLELSVFGHNAGEGPIGGYYEDNEKDLSRGRTMFERGQMSKENWGDVDFNFNSRNSIASFYGCNSASWAEDFFSVNKQVKYTAGIAGRAGPLNYVKGDADRSMFYVGSVYMRAVDENDQVLPMYLYTRGRNTENEVYANPTVPSYLKK